MVCGLDHSGSQPFNLCSSRGSLQRFSPVIIDSCYFMCSEKQSTKVKMYMMDIMASVFQEGESLSQELLDAVLTNFVEPTKVCLSLL